jgi:hypothetical protein
MQTFRFLIASGVLSLAFSACGNGGQEKTGTGGTCGGACTRAEAICTAENLQFPAPVCLGTCAEMKSIPGSEREFVACVSDKGCKETLTCFTEASLRFQTTALDNTRKRLADVPPGPARAQTCEAACDLLGKTCGDERKGIDQACKGGCQEATKIKVGPQFAKRVSACSGYESCQDFGDCVWLAVADLLKPVQPSSTQPPSAPRAQ